MTRFKSDNSIERTIQVEKIGNGVSLTIYHSRYVQSSIILSGEDPQPFALSVLEAVDHGTYRGKLLGDGTATAVDHTMDAIHSLRSAVQAAESETEDQAKLEAEAWECYAAYYRSGDTGLEPIRWESLPKELAARWIAVAKAARETNK